MSDKVKFHNMTKPLKFRGIRSFAKNFSYTLSNVAEGIKSLIYNILYRLNIIEKYSFSDVMRNGVPITIEPSSFESGCISATLEFTVEHTDVVNECYYHKRGDRLKKLYVVMDNHLHELHITAHMTNIGIKMPDGKFQYVDEGLPVFRVHVNDEPLKPFNESEEIQPVKYHTKKVNMRKLQSLRFCHSKIVSEYYLDELKEGIFEGLFATARDQFTFAFVNYFREVKLYDLFEED